MEIHIYDTTTHIYDTTTHSSYRSRALLTHQRCMVLLQSHCTHLFDIVSFDEAFLSACLDVVEQRALH